MPMADQIRPSSLDDVVGQEHILYPNSVLRQIIENKSPVNMIFYGPPGTGKTTVANIAAKNSNRKFYKLNAVNASLSEIKDIIKKNEEPILLYLDEIQYFNKKQQQSLLDVMETGAVQLISSTTENPYFYVYGALLSRSQVFEFKPVSAEQVERAIKRAFAASDKSLDVSDDAVRTIAYRCGGDVRKAINDVELIISTTPDGGTVALDGLPQGMPMRYDRGGDETYDLASGLMKSMRGSDPDAALHYLARFIVAGDIVTPSRRILACASEDVGLASPFGITIVKACIDSANQLGLPEAQLPLAQAVLFICTAPKSNSVHESIAAAIQDVQDGFVGPVPRNLQNVHVDSSCQKRAQNYLYPHDYPNHWVPQQYMPDNLMGRRYYQPGDNPNEQSLVRYWTEIIRGGSCQ